MTMIRNDIVAVASPKRQVYLRYSLFKLEISISILAACEWSMSHARHELFAHRGHSPSSTSIITSSKSKW